MPILDDSILMPTPYSPCERQQLATHPPAVRYWHALAKLYFPYQLVPKALYVIRYESGGNPTALGDGGYSVGLFQIQHKGRFATRPSKEALMVPHFNIRYAAKVLRADHNVFTDWGEGALYQGQPFGALGNHPYPCNNNLLGFHPLPDENRVAQIVEAYPSRVILENAMYWMARAPELIGQYQVFQSYLSSTTPAPPPPPPPPPPPDNGGGIDFPDIDLPGLPDIDFPIGAFNDLLDWLGSLVSSIEEGINGLADGLIDEIGDITDEIYEGVSGTITDVVEGVSDTIESITGWTVDAVNEIGSTIDGMADLIEDSITFSGRLVTGAVDKIVSGMQSTLIPALETIQDLTANAISSTAEGALGISKSAVDALSDATDSALSVIDNVASSFVEITDGIANGIVDGIRAAVEQLVGAVNGVADFLSETFPELMRSLGSNVLDIAEAVAGLPAAFAGALVDGFFGAFKSITDVDAVIAALLPEVDMDVLI